MSPQPFSRAWFEDFAREVVLRRCRLHGYDSRHVVPRPGANLSIREPTQDLREGTGREGAGRTMFPSLPYADHQLSSYLLSDFYQVLHGMSHEIKTIDTDLEHRTIYAGTVVSYVVKGDREEAPISIPVMTLLRFGTAGGGEEMKARDLSVYFDPSSVFEKMSEVQSRA
ncbi:uncharacterized protein L3040_001497 [Drepanopeziza brunnea f. sp. 'multigermtubi']|uniref:uncharacterized protein n=1 Tax=Drepanopeziza brunnea f. sp. 'multigermtubi' TaxID=698441 RepID=UPI00238976D6|nr:hypothetical protein L3040_001497 [Drepanopeziza brunnea f. sp. 'multigermtubi']